MGRILVDGVYYSATDILHVAVRFTLATSIFFVAFFIMWLVVDDAVRG